jgi:hypothetical protein
VSHSVSKLLLLYAQQFEDQHAPQNVTIALREASAEIDKLRAALERMLLEFDFMVEGEIIPDVRNDVIFVEARAALSGDKQ